MKMQVKSGHPAKRTFQAIRIELNRELDVLRDSLDGMIDILDDGGRLCIITFHSLEDRIVKTIFRKNENPCTCPSDFPVCVCGKKSKGKVITRKPILPGETEMEENVYLSKFHAQKGHLEQLAELDNRFHDILYEACDSKMLEHQLKDFHQYVLRVRKKTLASANRGPKSNEEHEQIMEAIKAGNADLAEQLAHQHMINAYDNMVKNGLNEAYAQQDKPQE